MYNICTTHVYVVLEFGMTQVGSYAPVGLSKFDNRRPPCVYLVYLVDIVSGDTQYWSGVVKSI